MDISALRKEVELLDLMLFQVVKAEPMDTRRVAEVCDESHARQVLIELLEMDAVLAG